MKFRNLLILILALFFVGCSDDSPKSKIKIPEGLDKEIEKAHERITKDSILADFINSISHKKYEDAILLLHPKLREAWSNERFVKDWDGIREQLAEKWQIEVTNTFSGNSEQGPYDQVTYSLSSDFGTLSSVDLASIKIDGKDNIVQVFIRVLYKENPPATVTETIDRLTNLMFNEKFNETEKLMTLGCKQQFPAETIKKLRPILGSDESKIEKNYYRFCANTVWHDAVRIKQSGNFFSFLEFILSSENNESKIAALTFRGAIQ